MLGQESFYCRSTQVFVEHKKNTAGKGQKGSRPREEDGFSRVRRCTGSAADDPGIPPFFEHVFVMLREAHLAEHEIRQEVYGPRSASVLPGVRPTPGGVTDRERRETVPWRLCRRLLRSSCDDYLGLGYGTRVKERHGKRRYGSRNRESRSSRHFHVSRSLSSRGFSGRLCRALGRWLRALRRPGGAGATAFGIKGDDIRSGWGWVSRLIRVLSEHAGHRVGDYDAVSTIGR